MRAMAPDSSDRTLSADILLEVECVLGAVRWLGLGIALMILVALPSEALASSTTLADTFDRSDSTTLGQGWQETQGDLLINLNELRNAAGIAGSSIAIQGASLSDQQTVTAQFASPSNNSVPVLGFVLRYQNPTSYYMAYRQAGGTSVLRIARVSGGQETVLQQTGVPNPTANTLFRLTAYVNGGTISLTLEGGPTLTVSDASIASGSVGILLGSRTTNAALRSSQRLDNFSATVTTAGPATPALAVSLGAIPAPQSVAPDAQGVTFANVVLDSNGSAEDVAVSSLELELETDVGDSHPQACQLFDGANTLTTGAHVVNATADGSHTFALDTPLVVPMASQRTLRVACDVPESAAAGDTMEWRLRAGDVVDARGVDSNQAVNAQGTASPDNANKVIVQSPGVPGTIALADLRPVLRANEISLGQDVGEQAPGYESHFAMNFVGQAPPSGAWLAVCDNATYGAAKVCADHIDSEINGEQCGGVAALVTEGANGRAIVARSCDAKGTDTLRLGVLNMSTGIVTALATMNLNSKIDTYGGTLPPANCDHNRGQPDFHMYCQWIRTCLTVANNADGTVTFIASSWLRGSGPKNDPSRNDPNSPTPTLIGTATWTGPRPPGITREGKIGLVGTATQGLQRVSLTNLTIEP
jgi:hypothetical protein